MRTVPRPNDRVVIVGAGLGGLSAALHLAGAGRQVTVVEREPVPGGRCGRIEDRGYRFDTGPTVLTMPELLDAAFAAVGEQRERWLTLHRLDPAYRARFADGTTIDVRADVDAMADEIAQKCGNADAAGYRRLVDHLAELYRLEMPNFIDRNLDRPTQLLRPALARLVAMGGFGRLAPQIARFVGDERLRRLFTFQAMYAGLAPAQALAIYAVITYMDCVRGVFFPDGGMHAVPTAMAGGRREARRRLPLRHAGRRRIDVRDGRARGVITAAGERIPADVVVVNADLPTAWARPAARPRTPRAGCGGCATRPRPSSCTPARPYAHADGAHHTIDFGHAWDATFTDIIDRGRVMRDPSFLVTCPTRTDPTLAPATAATPTTCSSRRRTSAGSVDWVGQRQRHRDHVVAHPRGPRLHRLRRRDRGRAPHHPGRLAGAGYGAGRPVRGSAHLRADRTVPSADPRPADRGPGVLRLEHPTRRRRADGARVGTAGCRAGHRPSATMIAVTVRTPAP